MAASSTETAKGAAKGFLNSAKDWDDKDSLLNWQVLLSNDDDFEEDVVKRMDSDAWQDDCDIPVPPEFLTPVVDQVKTTATLDWTSCVAPETGDDRLFWATIDGKARLMYARYSKFSASDSHFVALEHLGTGLAVVCGHAGLHPFAASPRFRYSNSDGSAEDGPEPETPQPGSVIDYLLDRLQHHAGEDADH
mmetsp:Transcript_46717/g.109881  ORF Transcript_46717/g.109881 Transcript_46717/m.109881 type:complete len:192 (-) Transcript_46717:74-649(-)|eukprot:CAMPEP_0175936294 /NCGR_PEP_ID=MMETSP0108-20121206/21532_1 /TAXON_ID=195067 ORGANISM="Goniomonas pacifica, Strain CCMP1869" /NCGR_SAMPLE_ID=MMETSP0108 /ASSEMBLY_ACC=CAM_ASM_000204 /LENGTH=191 /DNA_ID=CAMNT_0017260361 /DNA_START=12 /DNA_END=587 /DNA_ORIENTATION=-